MEMDAYLFGAGEEEYSGDGVHLRPDRIFWII